MYAGSRILGAGYTNCLTHDWPLCASPECAIIIIHCCLGYCGENFSCDITGVLSGNTSRTLIVSASYIIPPRGHVGNPTGAFKCLASVSRPQGAEAALKVAQGERCSLKMAPDHFKVPQARLRLSSRSRSPQVLQYDPGLPGIRQSPKL